MRPTARCGAVLLCMTALATPLYAGKPPVHPNTVKYRDNSTKPATGRSGSAAIQARALRGQTGTDIEVTTGQFDSTAAPAGKLDKVQVKLLNGNGDAIVTDNYRKGTLSGATGRFTYDWPARGQAVQVQANVSGIDPNRTDVVTVGTNVALRPDLAVADIQAYGYALVDSNITIDALVRETNGDLGARANCVLKVDGVVADHADGIWVDAGDMVTCEFRQTFATVGTRQITVEVDDVVPGDYDLGNNSRSISIEIVKPTVPIWYSLFASDYSYDALTHAQNHQQFDAYDPTYLSWVSDSDDYTHITQHTRSYQGSLQAAMLMTFPIQVDSTLSIDGQAIMTPSFTIEQPDTSYSGDTYAVNCGEAYIGGRWFRVCTNHYDFGGGQTWDYTSAENFVRGGTVTYEGWSIGQTRYPDLGVTYVYESNWGPYPSEDGDPMPDTFGNNVDIRIAMTDANNRRFDAEQNVQLYEFPTTTSSWDNPCSSYDYSYAWGRYSGYNCSHTDSTNFGKTGSFFGYGAQ